MIIDNKMVNYTSDGTRAGEVGGPVKLDGSKQWASAD